MCALHFKTTEYNVNVHLHSYHEFTINQRAIANIEDPMLMYCYNNVKIQITMESKLYIAKQI
jgi:hypothetical protein